MRVKPKAPEVVLRNGRPVSVLVDIDRYQEMLERLEDIADLKALQAMRRKPLNFRPLEDVLKDLAPSVSSRR